MRNREQRFVLEGVNAALCLLAALATLVLVLPSVPASAGISSYSPAQLNFTAVVSATLYATFIFVQTIRHRDYFLPEGSGDLKADAHAVPPTARQAALSFALLLLVLVSVVLLAKTLAHPLKTAVTAAAMPRALVGIVIAALVWHRKAWLHSGPRNEIVFRRA